MRIWNLLLIYSSWSDAAKKADENDTAAVEKQNEESTGVYLQNVLPAEEYKEVEKDVKKMEMQNKLKNAGKRKKRGRVVGGTDVRSQTEFPEYVSLKTNPGHSFCGGTILDANHILTAAHCQPTAGQDKIVAGTIQRSGAGGSNHQIEKCIRYPQARQADAVWIADYEICKLRNPISIDGVNKKIVALGTEAEYQQYVKTGRASCLMVGMGRAGAGGTSQYKNVLQKLRKNIATGSMATAYLKYIQPQQNWGIVTASAEGSGKGGCSGDSGGPFFCTINGVRKQFGVASFADSKCGKMTAWYKPSSVMSWIKQNSKYGSGGGGSSAASSSSYSQSATNNRYQSSSNNQQNRYNQQNTYNQQNSYNNQRSTTSHSSGSSQKAAQVKKELQKLQTQISQMIALL